MQNRTRMMGMCRAGSITMRGYKVALIVAVQYTLCRPFWKSSIHDFIQALFIRLHGRKFNQHLFSESWNLTIIFLLLNSNTTPLPCVLHDLYINNMFDAWWTGLMEYVDYWALVPIFLQNPVMIPRPKINFIFIFQNL
jgi:hypothetical protein